MILRKEQSSVFALLAFTAIVLPSCTSISYTDTYMEGPRISLEPGADQSVIYKPDAEYFFHSGAWSQDLDLAKLTPVATKVINVGRGKDSIKPAAKGDSFVVVKGVIRVDRAGTYRFKPGSKDSEFNVMTVRGKEVSRRNLGDEAATQTEIALSAGYQPFEITFFKTSTPFAMSHESGGSGKFSGMKATHFWHAVEVAEEMRAELLASFAALRDHITGAKALDVKQVAAHKAIIDGHKELFGFDAEIIASSFDLVLTYDKVKGPLFVARGGWDKGRRRKKTPLPNDIHWTMYHVMQHIMDYTYTAETIARFGDTLDGFKFGSSAHFPGSVGPAADANEVYRVKINASNPELKTFHSHGTARRPTGAYVPPGSIVTVSVPRQLVDKGYRIRVGAHSWDNTSKRRVTRLARASLVYDIKSAETKVASPYGGGIYIEVPLDADAGVVELGIKNAVRSPYFSAKSFHKTSLEQWLNVERKRSAPWADFQSDKFMMQVPTIWITRLEDPVTLMENWDKAMDALNDLMGLPRLQDRDTLYLQVDLQNRGNNFYPGYPTCNDRYDPKKDYKGYANHYLVRGPQIAPNYVFHEQGHGFFCVKFAGEMESTVNLHHIAVWNQKFGYSLDEAFAASRGSVKDIHRTLDNAAITWMTSHSFVGGRPMHAAEKAYQLKGHAKYVDIARLFGWKVLGDFWKTYHIDVAQGIYKGRRGYKNDEISLRKSKAAGADLTPLLLFWGILPDNADTLKASVAEAKLPPSARIHDALMHYKSIIPKDNAAFRDFALRWWGKQPTAKGFWTEREHTTQWEKYDAKTAAEIATRLQKIVDTYFPKGRPTE